MFTGARKKNKREMDWQLVASYFTLKSTDIFCSVQYTAYGIYEKNHKTLIILNTFFIIDSISQVCLCLAIRICQNRKCEPPGRFVNIAVAIFLSIVVCKGMQQSAR